jgi:hypothetical protein
MMRWISRRLWLPAIPGHEPDPASMGMTWMTYASFHTCLAVSVQNWSPRLEPKPFSPARFAALALQGPRDVGDRFL